MVSSALRPRRDEQEGRLVHKSYQHIISCIRAVLTPVSHCCALAETVNRQQLGVEEASIDAGIRFLG